MVSKKKVLVLPGDYIGPEIVAEAVSVLETVDRLYDLGVELDYGLLGGAALDDCGVPLPKETLDKAHGLVLAIDLVRAMASADGAN